MSEFRFNRVIGDWVIIAADMARKPEDSLVYFNHSAGISADRLRTGFRNVHQRGSP